MGFGFGDLAAEGFVKPFAEAALAPVATVPGIFVEPGVPLLLAAIRRPRWGFAKLIDIRQEEGLVGFIDKGDLLRT